MSTLRKAFGLRIRELRKAQRLSQEALAEKAELHPTYIGGVERGERNLSFDSIAKIAHALGLSLHELFGFDVRQPVTQDELLTAEILGLTQGLEPEAKSLVKDVLRSLVEGLGRIS